MGKLLLIAILLVALCSFPVWAKPPETLLKEIRRHPLVYQDWCQIPNRGYISCLVYRNIQKDFIYVVLFYKTEITHILKFDRKGRETVLWQHWNTHA